MSKEIFHKPTSRSYKRTRPSISSVDPSADPETQRDQLFVSHHLYHIINRSVAKKKRPAVDESTETLPLLSFPKDYDLLVTSDVQKVEEWLSTHSEVKHVGIDCEWDCYKILLDRTVIKNVRIPDVVQLATETSCLLYQTNEGKSSPCSAFVTLLQNVKITKIWYNKGSDWSMLRNWLELFYSKHQVESITKKMNASSMDLMVNEPHGHGGIDGLCKKYLSKILKDPSSSVRMDRWSRITLTEEQRMYAAKDAYANLTVHLTRESLSDSEKQLLDEKHGGTPKPAKTDDKKKKKKDHKRKPEAGKKRKRERDESTESDRKRRR